MESPIEKPAFAPPPAHAVDGFAFEGCLGRGAMSVVYAASAAETGRAVALKILETDLIDDEDAVQRFDREARVLQRLSHPHIARLIGHGLTTGGCPFLVFERIDGPTLLEIIERREAIEHETALRWMMQAVLALDEAWKQHIIHRDIKPGNLMIDGGGELKIVDFGLAKMLFTDRDITRGRATLGTPRYMSPEMGMGHSLDLRSDIYSLGAAFYHLLTGQSPFEAETPVAMMMKHARSPLISPRALAPEMPDDLAIILTHMLAKEPERRYPHYADLISDLREAMCALKAREKAQAPPAADAPWPGDPSALDPRSAAFDALNASMTARSTAGEKSAAAREILEDPDADARRARAAEAEVEEHDAGWRAGALTLLAVLIILFGVGLAVNAHIGGDAKADGEDGKTNFPAGVARLFGAAATLRKSASPERQAAQNKDRMQRVMSAMLNREVETGRLPGSVERMIEAGALPAELGADVWGLPFRIDRLNRTLHSNGPDGAPGTADDFALDARMQFQAEPRFAGETVKIP